MRWKNLLVLRRGAGSGDYTIHGVSFSISTGTASVGYIVLTLEAEDKVGELTGFETWCWIRRLHHTRGVLLHIHRNRLCGLYCINTGSRG